MMIGKGSLTPSPSPFGEGLGVRPPLPPSYSVLFNEQLLTITDDNTPVVLANRAAC